ncbi:MAG: TRAP transporter permease [Synergistaceae bacterium]|nr:TRAP transporter permease [Synergistaceae bacterium]
MLIILCLAWAFFHLLLAAEVFRLPAVKLRAIHLGAALLMIFILVPFRKTSKERGPGIVDLAWIVAAVAAMGYTYFRHDTLIRMGGRYSPLDIQMGILGLVVLFEAARRVVSPGLVYLAAFMLLYAYFGQSFPEPFNHVGYSVKRIVQHLYLTGEGVFGFILGVSAEIIIVFVLFGAVLDGVGVADLFNGLANALTGRTRGGPAKIAVVSSALMGMVSGETSANVATTGVFTIPLMKKVGYPPHFAGAVECAASAGGQILPPVMGATAFVLADTLGIPYMTLAKAAFLPAILYFLGVFCTVHFRAVKLGLSGLSEDEIPRFGDVAKDSYLMLPLVGIVVLMLKNYTPVFSAFWGGIALAVLLSFFKKSTRMTPSKVVYCATKACSTAMNLAVACALVGTVVGVASLTGVTMTIADAIFKVTGGALFPGLIMTMFVALILGMGLPTTAAYVLTAISAVPVLLRLGMPEIHSHLFVFYFGVLSALTPPVCTGAYTAAGLAGADPNLTGFTGVRLAISGFIVPFLFMFDHELLITADANWPAVLQAFASAAFGVYLFSAVLEGVWFAPMSAPVRVLLGIGALLFIWPKALLSLIGLGVVVLCFFLIRRGAKLAAAGPH